MQPLVSICIPVYNVAPYIARCVCSLMEQTYDNLEYIFVDDCSTDGSLEVLKREVAKHPDRSEHVHVLVSEHNQGPSHARRIGVEAAQGEFIIYVDSDDYFEKEMVERLYGGCNHADCDLVFGAYVTETEKQQEVFDYSSLTHYDGLLTALFDNQICNLFAVLIRRSLFQNPSVQQAPDGMYYMEDRLTLLYLAGAARKFNVVSTPLYHYARRRDSVSYTKNEKHFRCTVLFWQAADAYLAAHKLAERYRSVTDREKLNDKIHLLHFCPDVSVCRQYADLFPEEEERNIPLSLPRGKQLTRFLTKHHLWLLLRCYKSFIALKTAKSL